jgi:hypothetical protein
MAAWVITWFANTRAPFKVAVTAPSSPQLFDALWPELLKWFNKLPEPWRALWDITANKITLKADQECFITARTSRPDQPEAMAGLHSQHILLVADEASGVDESVYRGGRRVDEHARQHHAPDRQPDTQHRLLLAGAHAGTRSLVHHDGLQRR